MELSIDMLSVGDADAFIIWAKHKNRDYIIFIDGGKEGDGDDIISHYRKNIMPHVETWRSQPEIIIINTHPHNDHVKGLPFIVNYFKGRISRVYMNNPVQFMSNESIDLLETNYRKVRGQDTALTRLYDSLLEGQELQNLITSFNIPIYHAFSDYGLYGQDNEMFRFLGPSSSYYQELINRFSSQEVINELTNRAIPQPKLILENIEVQKPCTVVDQADDTSAENLSSVITQFTTSSGIKYLFTGDAGVESFQNAKSNGFSIADNHYVQLPHHGSRRNVNSAIICEFSPQVFFVSAAGNAKHPRKAVIACIKKNTNAIVYSTHKTNNFRVRSNVGVFPDWEGYTNALPL
jgi:beta-lactamase superfamily II metal-dependent hydrolase